MSWANSVLPRFIGVSGEFKADRLPDRQIAVQIGDRKKVAESPSSSWFQAHGVRFNRTLLHQSNLSWSSTEKFKRRIEEILEQTERVCRNEGESGLILRFTPEAQARWIQAYNNIEFELTSGGFLFDIRDFGSKAADNIARIAALFHFFSNQEGDISVETVERASEVMKWYTYEFKRLFANSGPSWTEIPEQPGQ